MIWLVAFAALSVGIIGGFILGWWRRNVEHDEAVEAALAELAPFMPDVRDREAVDVFLGLVDKHLGREDPEVSS